MNSKILAAILVMLSIPLAPLSLFAESLPQEYVLKPGEEWKTAEQTVKGQIVVINPARIALEYAQSKNSAREIHLDLGDEKKIEFSNVKGLKGLFPGDIVSVKYRDKFVQNTEGKFSQYKRTVTAIALVKSGTRSDKLQSLAVGS